MILNFPSWKLPSLSSVIGTWWFYRDFRGIELSANRGGPGGPKNALGLKFQSNSNFCLPVNCRECQLPISFGLFWGPLFTWDFSNIGSLVKKIGPLCTLQKNSLTFQNLFGATFFMKEVKKSLQRPFLDVIVRRKFNSKGNYYSK